MYKYFILKGNDKTTSAREKLVVRNIENSVDAMQISNPLTQSDGQGELTLIGIDAYSRPDGEYNRIVFVEPIGQPHGSFTDTRVKELDGTEAPLSTRYALLRPAISPLSVTSSFLCPTDS